MWKEHMYIQYTIYVLANEWGKRSEWETSHKRKPVPYTHMRLARAVCSPTWNFCFCFKVCARLWRRLCRFFVADAFVVGVVVVIVYSLLLFILGPDYTRKINNNNKSVVFLFGRRRSVSFLTTWKFLIFDLFVVVFLFYFFLSLPEFIWFRKLYFLFFASIFVCLR